jgi:hypothetical protein
MLEIFESVKSFIKEIFDKEFLSKLSKVLVDYLNLFIKPIQSLKIAYGQKTKSINFLTLHLVYFTLFLFAIIQDYTLVFNFLIIELIFTFFPFAILIIPYKFFNSKFKLVKNWFNLFRVLIILKIQFNSILIAFYLIYSILNSELIFILIGNLIPLFLIFLLVTIPLISKINFFKRLLWFFVNYIFFTLFLILCDFGSEKYFGGETIIDDIHSKSSPYNEYLYYRDDLFNYQLFGSSYLIIGEINSDESLNVYPQFLTLEMMKNFDNHKYNFEYPENKKKVTFNLSLKSLDSLKNINDEIFNKELLKYKVAKDSALFKSNKKLFKLIYDYYVSYNNIHTDNAMINNFLENSERLYTLPLLDSNKKIILFFNDKSEFSNRNNELYEIESRIKRNVELSSVVGEILFFPLIFFY